MRYKNYTELTSAMRARAAKVPFAVVCAQDEHAMEAVAYSVRDNLIDPVFIGNRSEITELMKKNSLEPGDFTILECDDKTKAAQTAVELVHEGSVRGIMKGKMETGDLMRVLLKSENKLRVSSVVCSMSLMEVPHYHKLIAGSDPALTIEPTLEQKIAILQNAVQALTNIGIDMPKVAMLAAVETPSPKMPDTQDAVEIVRRNREGEITGCIVDGPLSYDLCMDPEAAAIKGLKSDVAGDPDLIIYPNLVTGNAVSKALVISAGAVGSSIILGTAVPVVLPSRSSSAEEKARNILLAAASAVS